MTPDPYYSERNLLQAAAEGKQITEAEVRVVVDRLIRARDNADRWQDLARELEGMRDAARVERDRYRRAIEAALVDLAAPSMKPQLERGEHEMLDFAIKRLRDATASDDALPASAPASAPKQGQP